MLEAIARRCKTLDKTFNHETLKVNTLESLGDCLQVKNLDFQVLHETGPAILISMLTHVFADAVGAVTSSPDITLLCVGNLVSLVINFAFQVSKLIIIP